jgi:microcystin-dependent protein
VVIGDDNGGSWPLGLSYGANDTVLTVNDIAAHSHTVSGGNTGFTGGTGDTANNFQPSLVMRWLISFFGVYPHPGGSVSFPIIGEMRLIAGPAADGLPNNQWKLLNGALYPIDKETEPLFFLIGTTYGGDGKTNFAVPDLRARVDAAAGPSLTFSSLVGSEVLSISVAQLAAHAHSLLQLRISAIQHFGNGSAQITLEGTVGYTCQVDKSDNLGSWSNLGAVQFMSGTATITDPNPTHLTKRFYKAYIP